MIDSGTISNLEKILKNKKITNGKLLSNSFNINCIKIITSEDEKYIVKYYNEEKYNFNAIISERDNLSYLNSLGINLFPKIYSNDKKYLIMSFIDNNDVQPEKTNNDLIKAMISLHEKTNHVYGFDFDTQIGGLKLINKKDNNWVDFFRENRLGYIYQLINNSNKMNKLINKKIELLLNNLENYIPKKPKSSLLHGDMWEGNILFNDKKLVGLIDPGSFYGHNELEIAYLRWFNPKFISDDFLDKYNEFIKIDNHYKDYEPIYQLYYSLLNVYLWDRSYVSDVDRLLRKIKI